MRNAVLAVTFIAQSLICLQAQDQLNTVTLSVIDIARQAQSRNLEILKAARSVERAREDLVGEPELMDSSLSVGGGYSRLSTGVYGWSGQSSLSLPLFPQLSVDGSLAMEETKDPDNPLRLGETLSLTFSPLASSRQIYTEEQAFNNARVSERYLKRSIYLEAERAALNLLIRGMERELARGSEELEQKKYELAQRRQEVGEASFQDVQDQLLDLIEVRQNLFNSEQRYLSDWRTLQLLFAPGKEQIAVQSLSVEEMLQWVEVRKLKVQRFKDEEPITEQLEKLRLELTALQAELKATPVWRPDLSLSTDVTFPYEKFSRAHSLSLNLSFSPDQLKRDEREELEEDIEVKRLEIAAVTYAAELQKTLGEQSIALVEQAMISARIQGDRDLVALQEAELLFQQGQRTTLELEQLRLNLRRTEILTFQAAAEVYRALGEYLALFAGEQVL